jgi:multidrug resistance efflux pump
MEILVTIAYFFLVRLVFFEYQWIRFTLFWKFVVFGLYAVAALTEVILLGQYGPYSKSMAVEAYVIQLAPEWGGIVKEVHVEANQPLKKGDPIFSMDPAQWEDRLAAVKADYDTARDEYNRLARAGRVGAVSRESIVSARDAMRYAKAEMEKAQYNVDHTTIYAPSDGYAVNLQLRPGAFIRLKAPVVDFVSTEEYYLIATVNQRAARFIDHGDDAEIALKIYPGKVFDAVVDEVVWASGGLQLGPGGKLPTATSLEGSEVFALRLHLKSEDPDYPLHFGATGLTAIYTGMGPSVFKLLRQLELRSESWLFYLYNPF